MNKSDHINLKWDNNRDLEDEEFYQIAMKQHPGGIWKVFETPKPCIFRSANINGLKAKTSYVFKVRVAKANLGGEGAFSLDSDVITTGESPAFRIMKKSEKIENNIPAIYRLPIQEVPQARNPISQTRKFILGIIS